MTDEGLAKIEGWAKSGLIDEQIANNMGIGYTTLKEWLVKFPSLAASIKRGKAVVDMQVENALLKRAMGFEYKETVTEEVKLPNGKVRTETKTMTRVALPDTTAQIFWLKNRRPDRWRDKQDVAVNAEPVRIVIDV